MARKSTRNGQVLVPVSKELNQWLENLGKESGQPKYRILDGLLLQLKEKGVTVKSAVSVEIQ